MNVPPEQTTFSIFDIVRNRVTLMMDMHELSVTQSILDIALKNAGTRKVKQDQTAKSDSSSSIVDDFGSILLGVHLKGYHCRRFFASF